MGILNLFLLIIIVALIAAFILNLLYKWGIIEHVQVHGNELFSKMFQCGFCLSFWVSFIITLFIFAWTMDGSVFLIPICATPITRQLI